MAFKDGGIEYTLSRKEGFEKFEFKWEDKDRENMRRNSEVYCKSYDDFVNLMDFWTANSDNYIFSPA